MAIWYVNMFIERIVVYYDIKKVTAEQCGYFLVIIVNFVVLKIKRCSYFYASLSFHLENLLHFCLLGNITGINQKYRAMI